MSWKYITDSISDGQLADMDIYRIDHFTAKGARPVGSTMSTKTKRTPYTAQDDNILIHWVLQKERAGEAIRGNKIYIDLAERYPRHTWQSWKDRFSKRYDRQHRDSLAALLPQGFEPPPPPPSHAPAPVCKKIATPSVTTTTVHTPAPSRPRPQPSSSVIAPTSRVPFTNEEDNILITYIKEMNRRGENLDSTMIYKQFAEQHPHHGWQFWRKRWVDQLQATTNLEEDEPADPVAPDAPEPSLPEPTPRTITRPEVKATPKSADQAAAKRRLSAALNRARQEVPTKSSPVPPARTTIASSAHKKSSPRSTPSRLEEMKKRARLLGEEKKKIKSASIIQRAWRSHQTRKQIPWRQSLVSFQAHAQGYLTRYVCAPALAESQSKQLGGEEAEMYSEDEGSIDLGQSPDEEISSEPAQNPREHFYTWFSLYNEGLETNPVPWVTIGGKAVDMWDLWSAVTDQDAPAHARDWEEIAEFLDFDWIAKPDVPSQLQATFQEHLAEFENFYKEYQNTDLPGLDQETDEDSEEEQDEQDEEDEETDEDSEEEQDEEDEKDEEAENEEIEEREEGIDADEAENTTLPQDPNTTEFRSSPPIVGAVKSSGGLKRNVDQLITSPLSSMTRKRLRYDMDDEVPESPPKEWRSPLPPIPEVASRPEEAADVTLVNEDEEDIADEEMPMFGDDEDEYEAAEEDREDNEHAFITQPQQPIQPTVERALSLRPSPASKSQAAQKKPVTQPSAESEADYIPPDDDEEVSDSSSDAFAPPIDPPRPPPERRRPPVPAPVPAPRPSTGAAPVVFRRQLPPRDPVPPPRVASRISPPRFRPIPPLDPFASNNNNNNNNGGSSSNQNQQRLARPRPRPRPRQHPSYPPNPPPKAPPHGGIVKGRHKGVDICSENPLTLRDRYISLGYKKRHCARGVLATTHDPVVAGRAIHALASEDGHTLPQNVAGIWTPEDDADLKEVEEWEQRERERVEEDEDEDEDDDDDEEIIKEGERLRVKEVERRLLEKHGRLRMELRRDFLKKYALA